MLRKKVYTIPEYLQMREAERNVQAIEREINSCKKDKKRYTQLVLLASTIITAIIQINMGIGFVSMFNFKTMLLLLEYFLGSFKIAWLLFSTLFIIREICKKDNLEHMVEVYTHTVVICAIVFFITKIIKTIITHFIY